MGRYLYTVGNLMGIRRWQVARETPSTIWIFMGVTQIKISKRNYRAGAGWDSCLYMEETPELLAKYKKACIIGRYKEHLKILESCTDLDIINQIMAIKWPKNK